MSLQREKNRKVPLTILQRLQICTQILKGYQGFEFYVGIIFAV